MIPLLLGDNQNTSCRQVEEWVRTFQAEGHIFSEFDGYLSPEVGNASSCSGLLDSSLMRRSPIGFAGIVGTHSMALLGFKVAHTSINPTVETGTPNLHWMQPGSFFY